MTYKPTNWTNRVYDDEGNILREGTPLLAETMNNIEQGIVNNETSINNIGSQKGIPSGYASLNSDGIVPSSQLPSNLKEMVIVDNLTERDLLDKFEGLRVYVVDATDDETVNVGAAEYLWDGIKFIKVGEAESLDINLTWENVKNKPTEFTPKSHTHKQMEIIDLDTYTQMQINEKLNLKSDKTHTHTELHTHSNKSVLDTITIGQLNKINSHETRIETLENGSSQLHTHNNKSILDKIRYSGASSAIDLIQLDELANHTHSYNNLTNKPSIPSKISDLTDDSEFIKSNSSRITVSSTAPTNPSINDIWIVV